MNENHQLSNSFKVSEMATPTRHREWLDSVKLDNAIEGVLKELAARAILSRDESECDQEFKDIHLARAQSFDDAIEVVRDRLKWFVTNTKLS